jgi:hypothetical protein
MPKVFFSSFTPAFLLPVLYLVWSKTLNPHHFQQVEAAAHEKEGSGITDSLAHTIEPAQHEEEAFAAAAAVEKDANQRSKPGENGESHFDQYPVLKQPIWNVPAELGTKMPPLDAFILSKAMMEVRAKKNVIVVTFANFAFMDFVLNWVKHLTEYEVSNILVGNIFLLNLNEHYMW